MGNRSSSFWLGIFLILLVIIAYTFAIWRLFTIIVPGGNDFMAHYTAWEAFFKQGYSPYSDEAALYTQIAIRGRPALPGEDQNRLTYPFYSGLVHAPFIFIDYALARAIYMVLLQAALIASLGLCLILLHWHPPPWLLAILIAWTILYYPHGRGIILGQFAIFGCFSLVGTLALLSHRATTLEKIGKSPPGDDLQPRAMTLFRREKWDILAGFLLVVSTMKPTLVFLVIPCLLLWAVIRRRWAFLGGFLGLLSALILGSFLLLPTWLYEFILRLTTYSDYTVGQSPVWLFTHQAVPILGAACEGIIVLALLAGMLWSWWITLQPAGEAYFYWTLSVTLIISNLIVPRSATTNYVMLLLPTIWVMAALDRKGLFGRQSWGRGFVLFSVLVSFAGLWWLHFATVQGNQEQALLFIPTPLVLGIVFLFGRTWLLSDARREGITL